MKKITKLLVIVLSLALLVGAVIGFTATADENGGSGDKWILSANVSYGDNIYLYIAVDTSLGDDIYVKISNAKVLEAPEEVEAPIPPAEDETDEDILNEYEAAKREYEEYLAAKASYDKQVLEQALTAEQCDATYAIVTEEDPRYDDLYFGIVGNPARANWGVIALPGIAAKNMGDGIKIDVYADGSAEPVDTVTYSVAQYFFERLYKNGTVETPGTQKDLYLASLEYGANAELVLRPGIAAKEKLVNQVYVNAEDLGYQGVTYNQEYVLPDGIWEVKTYVDPATTTTIESVVNGGTYDLPGSVVIKDGSHLEPNYIELPIADFEDAAVGKVTSGTLYDGIKITTGSSSDVQIKNDGDERGNYLVNTDTSTSASSVYMIIAATNEFEANQPKIFEAKINHTTTSTSAPHYNLLHLCNASGGTKLLTMSWYEKSGKLVFSKDGASQTTTNLGPSQSWFTFKIVVNPDDTIAIYANGSLVTSWSKSGLYASFAAVRFDSTGNSTSNATNCLDDIYFGSEVIQPVVYYAYGTGTVDGGLKATGGQKHTAIKDITSNAILRYKMSDKDAADNDAALSYVRFGGTKGTADTPVFVIRADLKYYGHDEPLYYTDDGQPVYMTDSGLGFCKIATYTNGNQRYVINYGQQAVATPSHDGRANPVSGAYKYGQWFTLEVKLYSTDGQNWKNAVCINGETVAVYEGSAAPASMTASKDLDSIAISTARAYRGQFEVKNVALSHVAYSADDFITSSVEDAQAHVHSFDEYVYNGDASCYADGTETATCACGTTDTRAAKGTKCATHTFTNYITNNNASCKANGTETSICATCNALDAREIAGSQTDHSYGDTYLKNADGHWQECTMCGEASELAAHEYGEYTYNENATCQADGTKTAECVCGETHTIAAEGTKLDHVSSNATSNGDATCDEDGTKTGTCDICGIEVTVTDEGSKLDHEPGESYGFDVDNHWMACKNCGGEYTAAEPHSFSAGACTVCGATYAQLYPHHITFTADTASGKNNNKIGPTYIEWNASNSTLVTDETTGDVYLHSVDDSSSAEIGGSIFTTDSLATYGSLVFEARFKMNNTSGTSTSITFMNSSASIVVRANMYKASDGYYLCTSGGSNWATGGKTKISSSTGWINLKIVLTSTSGVADIYVNGAFVKSTAYTTADGSTTKWSNVQMIRFNDGSGNNQHEYFLDNVYFGREDVHSFSTTTAYDENGHWTACALCGKAASESVAHTFGEYVSDGNGTCQEYGTQSAKCEFCDAKHTIADTVYGDHVMSDYVENNDATCYADGTKTGTCDICGVNDTIKSDLARPAHSESYKFDEDAHWIVCTVEECGAVLSDPEAHSFANGACSACGGTYAQIFSNHVTFTADSTSGATNGPTKVTWSGTTTLVTEEGTGYVYLHTVDDTDASTVSGATITTTDTIGEGKDLVLDVKIKNSITKGTSTSINFQNTYSSNIMRVLLYRNSSNGCYYLATSGATAGYYNTFTQITTVSTEWLHLRLVISVDGNINITANGVDKGTIYYQPAGAAGTSTNWDRLVKVVFTDVGKTNKHTWSLGQAYFGYAIED